MNRLDNRRWGEIRPLEFRTGVNRYAEGSCLVKFGHTEVLCTASVEEGVPHFLKNTGKGWVTAEYAMLPRSCQTRIPRDVTKGRINGRNHEIQRLIGRSLRSVIDFKRMGERTIWIDCDVLIGDGGTRCVAINGSYVALYHAFQKLIRNGTLKEMPLKDQVAAVSVGIINGGPLLDLCYEEDSSAEVDMNVVMTGSGQFVEIQGTAEGRSFSDTEMEKLLALAKKGIRQILKAQRKALQ